MNNITLENPPNPALFLSRIKLIESFQAWIKLVSDQYQMGGNTEAERKLIRTFCMVIGAWEESYETDLEELDPNRLYNPVKHLAEFGDQLNYLVQIHREMECSFQYWDDFDSDLAAMAANTRDLERLHKTRMKVFTGTLKRVFRNDPGQNQYREELDYALKKAIITLLAKAQIAGFTLEQIIDSNQKKLLARVSKGTLTGRGDNR